MSFLISLFVSGKMDLRLVGEAVSMLHLFYPFYPF